VRSQPFFVPSVIFIVISIPLVLRLIPPNRFYGVRTRHTLASREGWYAANRFAGMILIVAGAVYLEVARLFPYTRGAPDDFRVWLIHLAAFVLPLAVVLLAVRRKVRSL
jgi:uncharacterized membrane protein